MNLYENLFILRPELDETRIKELISEVEEIVKKNKGTIVTVENWGKKKLAYKIKKLRHGVYILITFKIKALMVSKIERGLQLKDDVLKYLTTTLDEKKELEKQNLLLKKEEAEKDTTIPVKQNEKETT